MGGNRRIDLRIRLQPKQSLLWDLWNGPLYTRLGSGGARGGAKSGGGRRCMLLRRLQYPRTAGLILRRTVPELYKSHIVKLYEEFPDLRPYARDGGKEWAFPNESRLFLGSAPTEKHMANFYSAEFADIMVDEAQEFSQDELEKLSGSCRCTSNLDITPKMIFSFMPGVSEAGLPPRGLPYLKRVFADGKLQGEELRQKWAFVQAYSWDNIEWMRKELTRDKVGHGQHDSAAHECPCQDCTFYRWPEPERRDYFITRTEYGAMLASLSNEKLRDAWLHGKWDSFEGQYFPQFDAAVGGKHVISREQARAMIKPWHLKTISGDWGFDHPHAVYFHALDEHNRVITFAEKWGRQLNETALGQAITAMAAGQTFRSFAFSWDAGKLSPRSRPNLPKSMMQLVADGLGPSLPKPHPADSSPGSRVSGARLMAQLLDSGMWLISEECTKLIECLPTLVRDPDNTEDVLKVDFAENGIGDDAYDGARMGLQHMLGTTVKPERVVLEEKLAAVRKTFAVPGSQAPTVGDPFAKFGGKRL